MNQLVLVVEDDAMMQKMALKVLRAHGFRCELATSGKDALAQAARLLPALVLMDLSLPEMNGWDATRALKANPELSSIPVVAITAHAMVGDREAAMDAGCSDCLTKPYEIADLIATVERFVGPPQEQKKSA
jgi:CheY-like chemotaxis protein